MRQLKTSVLFFLVMSLLFGIVYPLLMTGIARMLFPHKSEGSLITVKNEIIGSELIGQSFTSARYFHDRPSASDCNATNSGGSNYGPTNRKFVDLVESRVDRVRRENGLTPDAKVPPDMVLASGSGLDPDISLEAALIQVNRVVRERKIDRAVVIRILNRTCKKRHFGLSGGSYVNVLKLNLTLDDMQKGR
jgi:K+-transporting ATPase ATPase C chain